MCRFHQTSPESHFTKNLICSRVTGDGRITLSGMKLITTSGPQRDEQTLNSQEEYDRILRDQFGVVGESPWSEDLLIHRHVQTSHHDLFDALGGDALVVFLREWMIGRF